MPQLPNQDNFQPEITTAQYDYLVSLASELEFIDTEKLMAYINSHLGYSGDQKKTRLINLSKWEASKAIEYFKEMRDSKRQKDERQREMFEED